MSEPAAEAVVTLSLISHTNAGKTTLARTLLRQDIGEVADRAHVTQAPENYVLLETPHGDLLRLSDTPGFGDSARLLKRLRSSGNPIGWLLSQVWDRLTNQAFWSTQQAVGNVREQADLVLYVLNSSEDAAGAGYVDPEMQILSWIDKPVMVLLNQLGPPRTRDETEREERLWREQLAAHGVVREVLPFDAFARCWVQEDRLLAAIAPWLPPAKQEAFERLRAAWRERDLAVFDAAVRTLVGPITDTAMDSEPVAQPGWKARARALLEPSRGGLSVEESAAMTVLARRLDARVRAATDQLIRLHGLSGRAAAEVTARMRGNLDVARPTDPAQAGLVGGLVSGALSGLAADLAAGGLTLGAATLLGGILGALGSGGAVRVLNRARGVEGSRARWSPEFLTGRVEAAILRYLAIAHFGRGRGDYVESEYPAHWRPLVAEVLTPHREALARIWAMTDQQPASLSALLAPIVAAALRTVLVRLYPDAMGLLGAPAQARPMREERRA